MSTKPNPEIDPQAQPEILVDLKRSPQGVAKIKIVYPPLDSIHSVYANYVQISGRPPEDIAFDFCQIHSHTTVVEPDGSVSANATLGVRVHMTVSQAIKLMAILPLVLGLTPEEALANTPVVDVSQGQKT